MGAAYLSKEDCEKKHDAPMGLIEIKDEIISTDISPQMGLW
jgi:hypothetical protein